MRTGRLRLDDPLETAIMKLAEGVPEAAIALTNLCAATPEGSRVWVLYKDICGSSAARMIVVLRARQLGFLGTEHLLAAIEQARPHRDFAINVDALRVRVKSEIPRFAAETEVGSMPPFLDVHDLAEDQRIDIIGHRVVDHKERVTFLVENNEKADRYMAKLKLKFPTLCEMERGPLVGANVIFVKVAEVQ